MTVHMQAYHTRGETMYDSLNKEFEYYLANHEAFVSKYDGKFIVIKDETVIGVFDDELTAIEEISQEHELGTFFVQPVFSGADNYTQMFHSRVAFA